MTRDKAIEYYTCKNETVDFMPFDSTVGWLDDNAVHRPIFVVQGKNPTSILIEWWQRLDKQVTAQNLAMLWPETHMRKNLAFGFACSPKDRQQKISEFEPINIGEIKEAFCANTRCGEWICEEAAAMPFVSCEKFFTIAAKEWLAMALLS